MLLRLEAERQTGCMTIASADGHVGRVYLLLGKVFHAEGPGGEGQSALADAGSWPEVTLSFDEKATLPDKQTVTAIPESDISYIATSADVGSVRGSQTQTGNRRLTIAMFSYLGAGCLWGVLGIAGMGIAVAIGATHVGFNSTLGTLLGTVIVLFIAIMPLWFVLYIRYRFMFRAAAVEIPNGLSKAQMPRVIDARGIVSGEPELVVDLPARYLPGRLGKCRVEFYASGIQIWKGPEHPEPRWQFAYEDLLQAESVVMESTGSRGSHDQYSLRLIAAQPPMAFLFGNSFTSSDSQRMLEELRKHGVRTFNEA
jgi:hypothetical protein